MGLNPRKRRILLIPLTLLVVTAGVLLKPTLHLIRATFRDTSDLTPPPPGYVDDASRLNQTRVAEVWRMPVDNRDPEAQLADLLKRAGEHGLRVSIAGAQHTMGGHTIYPGGLVVDMTTWNQMELDAERSILKVQSGALWKDILAYLDPLGHSVAVMQSNNSFTVGGSISANCHGWQFDRPPIASTVDSFRLMLADGTVVRCSRTENQELFSLALGGYGLFGIILDVDLRVIPNELYRLEQAIVPIEASLDTFDKQIQSQTGLQMMYARMNIVPDRLFDEIILNAFYSVSGKEIPPLSDAGMDKIRRAIFRGSAESDYGKELRWRAETKLQPALKGKLVSRNQLLNEGVEVFQNRSADTTDILHEYFVPRHRVGSFTEEMKKILLKHKPDLLNVTVRMVNEDTDTFLRYADQQMIAFVMLYVQERTDKGEADMKALTQDLIAAALSHEGRFYLPYRLHATQSHFHKAYPQAESFFRLKRTYDPQELFQNQFYVTYGRSGN